MPQRPAPTLAESLAAVQAWWREAGVDYAYRDEPVGWLAEEAPADGPVRPAAAPAAPPKPAAPRIGGDRAGWPQELAAFSRWWLEEPTLDHGGLHPRIAPRVHADAELLLLVPMPEEADDEALLAGPHGRLLASFAQAAGLAPEAVALAAALPRHMPLPDWEGLASQGYGEVLLHLLGLARPKRLIVFGRGILPLLGHGPTQGTPAVSELGIQGQPMPLLVTFAPENLLRSARERQGLWQRWLEWTDVESA